MSYFDYDLCEVLNVIAVTRNVSCCEAVPMISITYFLHFRWLRLDRYHYLLGY